MLSLTRNCVIYHCQDSFWIIFPTALLKTLNAFEQMAILVILNVLSGLKKYVKNSLQCSKLLNLFLPH